MLILATCWSGLVLASIGWGMWLMRSHANPRAPLETWMLGLGSAWLGMHILAWVFFSISIFAPLQGKLLLGAWSSLFAISAVLGLRTWRELRARGLRAPGGMALALFAALILALAERSTWIGNLNDTGGYHWNIVQWINEFGVVSGLGLFQIRLGTTSSWLALTAAANAGALQERVLTLSNGALFLMACALFAVAARRIRRDPSRASDWFIASSLMLVVPNMLRWDMRLSPSPDIPAILAPLFVAWSMIRADEAGATAPRKNLSLDDPWLPPLVFSAIAVTVKLSALPLLPVSIAAFSLAGVGPRTALRRGVAAVLLVCAVLAPLVATSLIVTGCVLFPSPLGCFDWANGIGAQAARDFTRIVKDMAEGGITAPLLFTLAAGAALVARSRHLGFSGKTIFCLVLVAIAFVLFFAPTSRFARGYLILLPALAVAVYRDKLIRVAGMLSGPLRGAAAWIAGACAIAAFAWPLYRTELGARGSHVDPTINASNPDSLTWPNRLQYRGTLSVKRQADFEYFFAVEGTCWNAPIPCASNVGWPFIQDIRMANPQDLGAGFVRKP